MIIKLYARDNTVKIIEGVEDVNIHLPRYSFDPSQHEKELKSPVFGPNTSYLLEQGTDSVHYYPNLDPAIGQVGGQQTCRLVDFKRKNEGWQRLVVDCWAYVCNDDGKTIEKVEGELR